MAPPRVFGPVERGSPANSPLERTGSTATLAAGIAGANSNGAASQNASGSHAGELIRGTAESDVLRGGPGHDTLNGLAGDDTLVAGGGDDTAYGSLGADSVLGKDGNDDVNGGAGPDTLRAGDGDDTANGGEGSDLVAGDDGNDSLKGGRDSDTVLGGPGDDLVLGDAGDDHVQGGQGDDTLRGGSGQDTLTGGAGNDQASGSPGDDLVSGGEGDDVLFGGDGNDTLRGDGGDDTIQGGPDRDSILGHAGDDSLAGGADGDSVYGGEGNDTVAGGDGADLLSGGPGNDTLIGGTGDDTVRAGPGDDRALGDQGNDDLDGREGNDTLRGGEGNDTAQGATGRDMVLGQAGDDSLLGGDNNDTVFGGDGEDTVVGGFGDDLVGGGFGDDTLTAGAGDDTVRGGPGNDRAVGDRGNDELDGGGGNDTIFGGEGNDTALRGSGDDTLIGGAGANDLTGGAGADLFVIGPPTPLDSAPDPADADIVRDFRVGVDRIILSPALDGPVRVVDDEDDARLEVEFDGVFVPVAILLGQAGVVLDDLVNNPGLGGPIFTSDGVGTVEENGFLTSYAANVVGGATYEVAGGPDADRFAIDSLTGALSVIEPLDFEGDSSADGDPLFELVVRATNEDGSSDQAVTVTLLDVNDNAPAFSSAPSIAVDEGTAGVFYTATADDPDTTGSLTFSIESGPDSALFAIDSITGALSFITPPDFENPTDVGGDNTYNVTLGVSDGVVGDTLALTIGVSDVDEDANVPPPDVTITALSDTGSSDSDGITSVVGFAGAVAEPVDATTLAARIVGGGPFVDVSAALQPDGSFVLDEAILESLLGGPVADGLLSIEVQAGDATGNLSTPVRATILVDRMAPTVTDDVPDSFAVAPQDLQLLASERLAPKALAAGDVSLVEDGVGPIPITSFVSAADGGFTLGLGAALPNGEYTLTIADGAFTDLAGNPLPGLVDTFTVSAPTQILSISPEDGDTFVNVDRELTIEFNRPIDGTSLSEGDISLMALGEELGFTAVLSNTGQIMTLFLEEELPAGAKVRFTIDGDGLLDTAGDALDADGDGTAGGTLVTEFSTVTLTRIPNTNLEGFIFASNQRGPNGEDVPLEGVIVTVVGLPGVSAVTDAEGRFFLTDLPAPEIFLDFDASAVEAASGFRYGTIVKPAHTKAGETVPMALADGTPFNIFFAAIPEADAVPYLSDAPTVATLGPEALSTVEETFPDIDPSVWQTLSVTVPEDSLFFDDGTPATELRLQVFDPERIPAPTPTGLDPTYVFTVTAGGASNVTGKAQLVLPNIDGLPPGAERPILSFDHDAGKWVQTGIAIVSADGQQLVSEGDSGVNTLGWKFVAGGGGGGGGGGGPRQPPPPDEDPELTLFVTHETITGDGNPTILTPTSEVPSGPVQAIPSGVGFDPIIFEAPDAGGPGSNPYLKITIEIDQVVADFMKKSGLQFEGLTTEFILRPGDEDVLFNLDPKFLNLSGNDLALSDILLGSGVDPFTFPTQNTIYSGDVRITYQEEFTNGTVETFEEVHFVSRFIDVSDEFHDDGIISFPKTLGDDPGMRAVRELDLNFVNGSSGEPDILLITDGDGADFGLSQVGVFFDPQRGPDPGLTGVPRLSQSGFSLFNPNVDEEAGFIGLQGQALSVQEVFFNETEFVNALTAFLASPDIQFTTLISSADQTSITNDLNNYGLSQLYLDILDRAENYFFAQDIPVEFVDAVSGPGIIDIDYSPNDGNLGDGKFVFAEAVSALEDDDVDAPKILDLFINPDPIQNQNGVLYEFTQNVNIKSTGLVEFYLSENLLNAHTFAFNDVPAIPPGTAIPINLPFVDTFVDLTGYVLAHEVAHYLGLGHTFIDGSMPRAYVVPDADARDDVLAYIEDFTNVFPPSFTVTEELIRFATGMSTTFADLSDAGTYLLATIGAGNVSASAPASGRALDPVTGEFVPSPALNDGGSFPFTAPTGQALLPLSAAGGPLIGPIDFGELETGESIDLSLDFLNFGQTGVREIVSIVEVNGTNSSPFSFVIPDVDDEVLLGQTLESTLTFTPTAPGAFETQFIFETGEGTLQSIRASGTAVSLDPLLTVARSAGNFGGVDVDGETGTITFTLGNDGLADLVITEIALTGADFTLVGADLPVGGITLATGETFAFSAEFDPSRTGLTAGLIDFTSNSGPFGVDALALNGTGLDGQPIGETGEDFVLVEIDGIDYRAISDENGDFSVFLPSDRDYTISVFDPETGLIAKGGGVTAPNGGFTELAATLVFLPSTDRDTDLDGLPDDIERAIGTSPTNPDTSGDGLSDFALLGLGEDPTDGAALPTAVIAGVPLPGIARDLTVVGSLTDPLALAAYVATGPHGMAVVDVSNAGAPVLLGVLLLPGTAMRIDADPARDLAFVAAGSSGLHIVSVADALMPELVTTVTGLGEVSSVLSVDGITLVGGDVLAVVASATGEILNEINVGGRVGSLAFDGETVFAVVDNARLVALGLNGVDLVEASDVLIPTPPVRSQAFEDLQVFVDDGIAFVANGIDTDLIAPTRPLERGGLITFDVSDVTNLVPISNIDTGDNGAGNLQTVTNGARLAAVASGSFGVTVLDVSDPANTFDVLASVPTGGDANAIALAAGIAFVAADDAGLEVVNFLPFDGNGVAPEITLDPASIDIAPGLDGIQVQEGTIVSIDAAISDDVQVRSVEVLVDGVIVRNDVSAPYDLSFRAPTIAESGGSVELQIRALDTGGNASLSELLTLEVTGDIVAPDVSSVVPPDGGLALLGRNTVEVSFTEPVDAATLSADALSLTLQGSADAIPIADLVFLPSDQRVRFVFQDLAEGVYDASLDLSGVLDLAGNAFAAADFTFDFEVTSATARWTNPLGGAWTGAVNWLANAVPTAADGVLVELDPGNRVTHSIATTEVARLRLVGDFEIDSGTFSAGLIIVEDGTITLDNGIFADSVIDAPGRVTLIGEGGDLRGVTINTDAVLNTSTELIDGAVINGTLTVGEDGGPSATLIVRPGTIEGTGTIVLNPAGAARLQVSGVTSGLAEVGTLGADLTVRGVGDVTTSLGDVFALTGTLIADGGEITVRNDVTTLGAALTLGEENAGDVVITARLQDAVLAPVANAVIDVASQRLVDVTFAGDGLSVISAPFASQITVTGNAAIDGQADFAGNTLVIDGDLSVDGTLSLIGGADPSDTARLEFIGGQTVTGAGAITLSRENVAVPASVPLNEIALTSRLTGPEIVTFAAGIRLEGDGGLIADTAHAFRILGTVAGGAGGTFRIDGVDQGGGTLAIDASVGSVALAGSLTDATVVSAPGTTGPFDLLSGRLDGVTFDVDARLLAGAAVLVEDGFATSQTLSIEGSDTTTAELRFFGEQTIAGDGEIVLSRAAVGSSETPRNSIVFEGVSPGTFSFPVVEALTIGEDFVMRGEGLLAVDQAGDVFDIDGLVRAEGGTLSIEAIGAVDGTLEAAAGATLAIASGNDLVLTEQSDLIIRLDSGSAGRLDVSGNLTRGGVLSLDIAGGFTTNLGDSFEIATATAFEGAFDGFENFDLAGNLAFRLVESAGALTLEVVTDAEASDFINAGGFTPPPSPPDELEEIFIDELPVLEFLADVIVAGPATPGGGPVQLNSIGTLRNVTLATDAVKDPTGRTSDRGAIEEGLTLDNATLLIDGFPTNGGLTFNGEQSVAGSGTIRTVQGFDFRFGDDTFSNGLFFQGLSAGAERLTIGSGISLEIFGEIDANDSSDTISIAGPVRAMDRTALSDIDNDGATLMVDASGGRFTLFERITDTVFEAAPGQTGRLELLDGTYINVTFAMDAEIEAANSVLYLGGRVIGSTEGRTIGEPQNRPPIVTFERGLTLDATLTVAATTFERAVVTFFGEQTISGTGEIILSGQNALNSEAVDNRILFDGTSFLAERLVVAEGTTIRGEGTLDAVDQGDQIEIAGALIAERTIEATDLAPVTGTLGAVAGALLDVNGTLVLDPSATVEIGLAGAGAEADAGLLAVSNVLDVAGTLALDVTPGFTAELDDEFVIVAARDGFIGSFDAFSGFDLTGPLGFALVQDETTLSLRVVNDAQTGRFFQRSELPAPTLPVLSGFNSGLIDAVLVGGPLAIITGFTTFTDVELAVDIDVAPPSSGTLTVNNSLVLDDVTLALRSAPGGQAIVRFNDDATVSGTGTILLDETARTPFENVDAGVIVTGTSTVTFEDTVTFRGAGRIDPSFNDRVAILGDVIAEEGILDISNVDNGGADLSLEEGVRGEVFLTGRIENTTIAPAAGSVIDVAAILDNVTIAGAGRTALSTTLTSNVTIAGEAVIDVAPNVGSGGLFRVQSGLVVDGTLTMAGAFDNIATLEMDGTQTIEGTGTIHLSRENALGEGLVENALLLGSTSNAAEVLTIGAGVTVRGDGTVSAEATNDTIRFLGIASGEGSGTPNDPRFDGKKLNLNDIDNDGAPLFYDGTNGRVGTTGEIVDAVITEGPGGGGEFLITGGLLSGVTVAGNARVLSTSPFIPDELTVDGTLVVSGGSLNISDPDPRLSGSGDVVLEEYISVFGNDERASIFTGTGPTADPLNIGPGLTVRGEGLVWATPLTVEGSLIAENGLLDVVRGDDDITDPYIVTGTGTVGARAGALLESDRVMNLEPGARVLIGVAGAGDDADAGTIGGFSLIGTDQAIFEVEVADDFVPVLGDRFEVDVSAPGVPDYADFVGFDLEGPLAFALVNDGFSEPLFLEVVNDADAVPFL